MNRNLVIVLAVTVVFRLCFDSEGFPNGTQSLTTWWMKR